MGKNIEALGDLVNLLGTRNTGGNLGQAYLLRLKRLQVLDGPVDFSASPGQIWGYNGV